MVDPTPAAPPPPSPARRRWVKPVAILAVVILAAAGAWYFWGRSSGDGSTDKASDSAKSGKAGKAGKGGRGGFDPSRVQPVAAATARTGDVNIVQTSLGTVTALRTVTVKPRVDGQLQSVSFTEGQVVKAGDTLAQIDPVPLQVAVNQAEGTLARDAAQLNNARLDLERYRTLLAQDSIAAQQVDSQAALVRQLEGTVKVDQAQVDNAKLQLSYTRISAPLTGRVGLRQVDAGNMVSGSDPNGIAVITQIDPVTVLFTIPQDNLQRVLARLNAGDKPAVEAWDREQKSVLARGVLLTTDNQIDVTTGTVKLKAQLPNEKALLFPNQFVNIRMVVDTLKGVVVVPSAAIQRGAQGTIVYALKDDSTVTLRPVVVGPTEGPITAVMSGLAAGERVVIDGVDRIREGVKVEVTEPAGGARGARGAGKGGDKGASPDKGAMDPAKREEYKKRLEAMTPEQREEFKKRREARQAGEGKAPQ